MNFISPTRRFFIDAGRSVRLLGKVRTQLENVFASWAVAPAVMDQLWAGAWWHLGTHVLPAGGHFPGEAGWNL